jgi:hypothetical protein
MIDNIGMKNKRYIGIPKMFSNLFTSQNAKNMAFIIRFIGLK